MARVVLIVLDSLGIGELPDAHLYNDIGSNTLLNIKKKVSNLKIPNLCSLGIYNINNTGLPKFDGKIIGNFGKSLEQTEAKDTISGHFEMMGLIMKKPYKIFSKFPSRIITLIEKKFETKLIGNYSASGTKIIEELGDYHKKTGYPIIYTSADSVMQIAMHENIIPLSKQYDICKYARQLLVNDDNIGRVICRPFKDINGIYHRTENRKDFALDPPGKTILDLLVENNIKTVGVGKISDIFNNKGITDQYHTKNNLSGIKTTIDFLKKDQFSNDFIFTNLVDFDMLYGHRNDAFGYAKALEIFDKFIPDIIKNLNQDDMLIITADHGCDPTTPGTDHTREHIPILVYGKNYCSKVNLGLRNSFSDIGETIADFFNLSFKVGKSFLPKIKL